MDQDHADDLEFEAHAVEQIRPIAMEIIETVQSAITKGCWAEINLRQEDLNLLTRLLNDLPRIPDQEETVSLDFQKLVNGKGESGQSWMNVEIGPHKFSVEGGSSENSGMGHDYYPGPEGFVRDDSEVFFEGNLYDLVDKAATMLGDRRTTVTISFSED